MLKDWANGNELWADVLVETLRRKGVDYAVTCPGSRNSPLIFALARNPLIEAIPILDERSAAFFALGLAKRTGKPVAITCTSGSAVANFFPAVVEASESGFPLLLLTADRPPELQDCAAGQTIDQVKFFGGYVRKQHQLALPENRLLRYLRETVSACVDATLLPAAGPVHLNIPFRDPLIPISDENFQSPFTEESYRTFFDGLAETEIPKQIKVRLSKETVKASRGLVVVGPCSPINEETWCENLADFSNELGWPVLSDALNPVRSNASLFQSLVCGYEFVIRNEELKQELEPEEVIVVGEFPTCKVLRDWLTGLDANVTLLSNRFRNLDPTHSKATRLPIDFELDSPYVENLGFGAAYCERWLDLDQQISEALQRRFENLDGIVEPKAAWELSHVLPEWSSLCISNSMPPRDMEFYFPPRNSPLSLYSSRGANGIDGILSTAMGVAHEGEPTYLLTGDLALLHDSNGALIAKQLKGSLTIILINNSGGGIFQLLPVSRFEDVFEKHWGTDQEIDFENWARTYGIAYERIESWDQFREVIPNPPLGIRLLEVRTDRKVDVAYRKTWFREIVQSLQ